MAKDIFRTPLAEVRWAHLITPRHQLDKSKPKAWTCDLLLPNSDQKAQSFLLGLHRRFEGQRQMRLKARAARQVRFDAGALPDFRIDTADIRAGDWRIAPIPAALVDRPLAQEAVRQAGFADMQPAERHFMLMPLMHSESRKIHEAAERLFARYTTPYALDFELKHKVIIDRFGRYPHRNEVLGRESTAEEAGFLLEPGSSF